MSPTLRPGDRLLVDRAAYDQHAPAPGEIVVLEDPEQGDRWLVKRVAFVGPGTWARPDDAGGMPHPVPEGHVIVLGDAAIASRDSRTFGPVRVERVVGRVRRRYAPPDRRSDL